MLQVMIKLFIFIHFILEILFNSEKRDSYFSI